MDPTSIRTLGTFAFGELARDVDLELRARGDEWALPEINPDCEDYEAATEQLDTIAKDDPSLWYDLCRLVYVIKEHFRDYPKHLKGITRSGWCLEITVHYSGSIGAGLPPRAIPSDKICQTTVFDLSLGGKVPAKLATALTESLFRSS